MPKGKVEYQGRTPGFIAVVVVGTIVVVIQAGSCFLAADTIVCEKTGVRCPSGWVCSQEQDGCTQGGCGDGNKTGQEECDDGNVQNGDSCSFDCYFEICGNGRLNQNEECDDGNLNGNDGCSAECRLEQCGNGVRDPGEVCDDGNTKPGDGCSATCKSNEVCGNGVMDDNGALGPLHEECEFMPAIFPVPARDAPDCNSDCTIPKCGDGHYNKLFLVKGAGPDHLEQCDTVTNSSTCDDDCTIPVCGDGHVNGSFIPPGATLGEQCDNGTANSDSRPDACRKNCQMAFCGDDVVDTIAASSHPHEECDDGIVDIDDDGKVNNDMQSNACRSDCKKPFCGDGVIDKDESCDPGGNYHNGPIGCSGSQICVNGCKGCMVPP